MRPIPASVKDFPALIQWLVDTEHGGVVLRMAARLEMSASTPEKWLHRLTHSPKVETLIKIAATYNLNLTQLIQLAGRTPRGGTARQTLAGLLLALTTAGGVLDQAETPAIVENALKICALSEARRRRHRGIPPQRPWAHLAPIIPPPTSSRPLAIAA